MGLQWELAKKYLHYYFTAGNRHDVHSPFVYTLADKLLRDKKKRPEYADIEQLRSALKQSTETLQVTDLGAGSLVNSGTTRKVSDITRHAAKPPKFGQLFYRLIQAYKPEYLLELGTSMGMSTSYMAKANPAAKVMTIEGCPNIAARAGKNFETLGLKNIKQYVGNFDTVLGDVLKEVPRLDYVYIDGNHRSAPTLTYFGQCLEKAHDESLFIFDDIHWTPDMEAAWHKIQDHPRVTFTVDLFFIGLVFFRPDMKIKQHFVLKY
jgi:predicted O-methyltransferase YrrM